MPMNEADRTSVLDDLYSAMFLVPESSDAYMYIRQAICTLQEWRVTETVNNRLTRYRRFLGEVNDAARKYNIRIKNTMVQDAIVVDSTVEPYALKWDKNYNTMFIDTGNIKLYSHG